MDASGCSGLPAKVTQAHRNLQTDCLLIRLRGRFILFPSARPCQSVAKRINAPMITTCIFDAYGTLFDVAAAARQVASEPGRAEFARHWPALSAKWRQKQLQYSWLRTISGDHTDFWTVTQDGLDWAMEAEGLAPDTELRDRLLALYWQLSAFAEVPATLAALRQAGLNTAILSNGSPEMLSGAVQSAGLSDLLDDVLSVESVGVFKPAPQVYDMVIQRFGCAKSHVLFVSSNGWDASAAAAYGFRTVWVNRAGEPVDRLPGQPDRILTDLTTLAELVTTDAAFQNL